MPEDKYYYVQYSGGRRAIHKEGCYCLPKRGLPIGCFETPEEAEKMAGINSHANCPECCPDAWETHRRRRAEINIGDWGKRVL